MAQRILALAAAYIKLGTDYNACQKLFDDAISWTTLLENPEKLLGNTIITIFFQQLMPRFEAWCNSKPLEQKIAIAQQMQMSALGLVGKPAADFINEPERASPTCAIAALSSFLRVTYPFYVTVKVWCASHESDPKAKEIWETCNQLVELTRQILNLKA